jgi:ribosomal protein L6P/L9E
MIADIDGEKMVINLTEEIRKKRETMKLSGSSAEQIENYTNGFFDGYEATLKHIYQRPVIH